MIEIIEHKGNELLCERSYIIQKETSVSIQNMVKKIITKSKKTLKTLAIYLLVILFMLYFILSINLFIVIAIIGIFFFFGKYLSYWGVIINIKKITDVLP